MGRRWTGRDEYLLADWFRQGWTDTDIAFRLHRTVLAVQIRRINRLHLRREKHARGAGGHNKRRVGWA